MYSIKIILDMFKSLLDSEKSRGSYSMLILIINSNCNHYSYKNYKNKIEFLLISRLSLIIVNAEKNSYLYSLTVWLGDK